MKQLLLLSFIVLSFTARAQKVDSIYVNLYTDSLKRGTYNYINIDGLLSDGRYFPLDSSHLDFSASAGKFSGNSLWIDPGFNGDKVSIRVVLKKNPSLYKEFDIYIKLKPDGPLRTEEEIMNDLKQSKKTKRS